MSAAAIEAPGTLPRGTILVLVAASVALHVAGAAFLLRETEFTTSAAPQITTISLAPEILEAAPGGELAPSEAEAVVEEAASVVPESVTETPQTEASAVEVAESEALVEPLQEEAAPVAELQAAVEPPSEVAPFEAVDAAEPVDAEVTERDAAPIDAAVLPAPTPDAVEPTEEAVQPTDDRLSAEEPDRPSDPVETVAPDEPAAVAEAPPSTEATPQEVAPAEATTPDAAEILPTADVALPRFRPPDLRAPPVRAAPQHQRGEPAPARQQAAPARQSAPARQAPARQAAPAPERGQGGTSRADPQAQARYASAVRSAVAASFNRFAGRRSGSGTATVAFTVNSAGRVVGVRLTGSSGHSGLDSAAVSAVQRARIPAFPQGVTGSQLSFTVPLGRR